MDDYIKLLILAYFKQKKQNYSISKLLKALGIGLEKFDNILDELMTDELLVYDDEMLILTQKGRLDLMNNTTDYYNFDDKEIFTNKIDQSSAWPLDKVYVPAKFLTKL